jgi:AraC family transcriptional regulator of adaptative response/methylated-DNA-[protein]-cysteine methyltransferase
VKFGHIDSLGPMSRIGVPEPSGDAYGGSVTHPDTDLSIERVARACRALHDHGGPMRLADLATIAGCSARQMQRDFAEVLGTTPVDYGRCVRTDAARVALRDASRVTDAIFDAGYGSVRAFYEETARRLGMTPSDYAAGAPAHLLLWSVTSSSIGGIIAIASPRGLCRVVIGDANELLEPTLAEFPAATLIRDDDAMVDVMRALTAIADGVDAPDLPMLVTGTAFQSRVWAALRQIPAGETRTYSEVAEAIGEPQAVRAVANACGANPTALAIPCHRVIRTDGSLGGYRWGLEVKEHLLAAEATTAPTTPQTPCS